MSRAMSDVAILEVTPLVQNTRRRAETATSPPTADLHVGSRDCDASIRGLSGGVGTSNLLNSRHARTCAI